MAIIYKLKETLENRKITKNKLAVQGKFRVATLHDLESGKAKSISFELLNTIIKTVNEISEDEQGKITLTDVIDYVPDEEKAPEK